MHAVSWFLPALRGGEGPGNAAVPGWEAFLFVATSLVPDRARFFDPSYRMLLVALSVLSTVLFVLASPWIIWRGSRRLRRASAWAAVAGFVINVQWYVISLSNKPDLGVGYFLWWWSFALLAIGLFDLGYSA